MRGFSLSPHHTGRADFPHPAFPRTFAAGMHMGGYPMLGLLAQSGAQKRESCTEKESPALLQVQDDRSGNNVQAEHPSFSPHTSLAGPLRSTGVTPLLRYYAPRRLPIRTDRTVIFSHPSLDSRPSDRVSQVPDRSFATRCPLSPRRVRSVQMPVASRPLAGFTTSGGMTTLDCVTRPNRVHNCCGSSLRLARLRTPDYSDARSRGYMSNGQFTWQAPFSLRDLPDLSWRTRVTEEYTDSRQS